MTEIRINGETQSHLYADRYEIVSELGRGGMAKVYKARDTYINRLVALKVLDPEFIDQKNRDRKGKPPFAVYKRLFGAEARNTGVLNSERIVAVLDYGQWDDQCFISMEYVDGCSLREALIRHGEFSPYATATIAKQLCEALEIAHLKGVIHNDLKPANVMMCRTGDVKLTDFGIAGNRSGSIAPTSGIGNGSGLYMSPEAELGKETLPSSDVYSLGVTLYELCAGTAKLHELLETRNGKELLRQNAIEANPIDAEGGLSNILARCTQPDSKQRYQTVGSLKRDIERYLRAHEADRDETIVPRGKPHQAWIMEFFDKDGRTLDKYGRPQIVPIRRQITLGQNGDIALRGMTYVSRRHALVKPWGACVILEDLDSKNGTLLNGEPVLRPSICYDGDIITLGPKNEEGNLRIRIGKAG